MQGRRHAWWTPEVRLLSDRRRAIYIEARRAQERGLETCPPCMASGGASRPKSGKWCARPSRSSGEIRCTRAMISSRLSSSLLWVEALHV